MTFVTDWVCGTAFQVAGNTLDFLLARGWLPPFEDGEVTDGAYTVVCDGNGDVINEQAIGEEERGKRFVKVAGKKAEMSAREKMSTRQIIAECRVLPGDTKWPGGIWHSELGIAIGVSGLWSRWDEALAEIIAAVIEAELRKEIENESTNFCQRII